MFRSTSYAVGLEITDLAACNFERLRRVSNEEVLLRAGRPPEDKLLRFLSERMGIRNRYQVDASTNALDLARDALRTLLARNPELRESAELLIFAGISNPMPTVCLSALLANELELPNVSCWDVKSGCSTALLALAQSLDWFQHGAKTGIIVSAETFSKFTRPDSLEMAASTGDGACALAVRASSEWKVRGVVHGTDAALFKSAYVPGTYPIDPDTYDRNNYFFAFDNKPGTLERLATYWVDSLRSLLELSQVDGSQVTHNVSHQVDGSKNPAFARACGIKDEAIAMSFEEYGNMGAPTVFLNLLRRVQAHPVFRKGDVMVLHAVGGGLSYAGMCLEKIA